MAAARICARRCCSWAGEILGTWVTPPRPRALPETENERSFCSLWHAVAIEATLARAPGEPCRRRGLDLRRRSPLRACRPLRASIAQVVPSVHVTVKDSVLDEPT